MLLSVVWPGDELTIDIGTYSKTSRSSFLPSSQRIIFWYQAGRQADLRFKKALKLEAVRTRLGINGKHT